MSINNIISSIKIIDIIKQLNFIECQNIDKVYTEFIQFIVANINNIHVSTFAAINISKEYNDKYLVFYEREDKSLWLGLWSVGTITSELSKNNNFNYINDTDLIIFIKKIINHKDTNCSNNKKCVINDLDKFYRNITYIYKETKQYEFNNFIDYVKSGLQKQKVSVRTGFRTANNGLSIARSKTTIIVGQISDRKRIS